MQSMAHDLLNETATDKGTMDRRKLGKPPPPGGFQIVGAQRIEDSAMWERYAMRMVEIQQKATTKTTINAKTTAYLSDQARDTLNSAVNEVTESDTHKSRRVHNSSNRERYPIVFLKYKCKIK